jgi:hypothetical protein
MASPAALARIAAQMDGEQKLFLFPMWSNANIPAAAMRLLAFRDEGDALIVVQTIGVHWAGDTVLRLWNVYGSGFEAPPRLDADTLVGTLRSPPEVTLTAAQESRVQRTVRRSIPDARSDDRVLFLAFARAVEAKRRAFFIDDRDVLGRFGRPSMQRVARYRDWPELDLADDEMPSASRFFRRVLARVATRREGA